MEITKHLSNVRVLSRLKLYSTGLLQKMIKTIEVVRNSLYLHSPIKTIFVLIERKTCPISRQSLEVSTQLKIDRNCPRRLTSSISTSRLCVLTLTSELLSHVTWSSRDGQSTPTANICAGYRVCHRCLLANPPLDPGCVCVRERVRN